MTVWFGSTIFAALAVAIGYRFAPDQVQPITLIVYFIFAILGGLWFPLSGFLGKIGQFTPTYEAVKIGTDVIGASRYRPGWSSAWWSGSASSSRWPRSRCGRRPSPSDRGRCPAGHRGLGRAPPAVNPAETWQH